MPIQSDVDAGFYSLVHEVLEAERSRSAKERRGDNRRSYDCIQLIAPYRKARLPSAAEFRHVRCQDLSPGGMAYYDAQPPQHKELLVLLGPAPFIYLTAVIAHHAPVLNGDRAEYLIGCRFTGRLVTEHDKENARGARGTVKTAPLH
jgi:hypothetical protein